VSPGRENTDKKNLAAQALLDQFVDLYQSDPGVAALGLVELLQAPKNDATLGAALLITQALQTIVGFGKEPPVLRVKTTDA